MIFSTGRASESELSWGYANLPPEQKEDLIEKANARVQRALNLQMQTPLVTDWEARKALTRQSEAKTAVR